MRRTTPVLSALCLAILATTSYAADFDAGRASTLSAPRGQALGVAAGTAPANAVFDHLRTRGRDANTVASVRQVGARKTRNGVTHLMLEQQVGGLVVHGRYVKAAVNANGELVHVIEHLAPVPAGALAAPAINEQQALKAALARVHPGEQLAPGQGTRNGNATTFARGAFFFTEPSVTRVAVPLADGTMETGMLVETWSRAKNQLHHTLVGRDGRILDVQSRTANDSYNIFPVDPGKTPQTVVAGPGAGNAQSPAGWLGTGPQLTTAISGNNVNAYLDADANNKPDKGGTAVTTGNFLQAADFTASPSTANNRAVAVQNLFYLNNVIHDILYTHGFDEAAGNFQENNFALGGKGSDPVLAEAQDGSGTDNANFATPADGRNPRMQMYLWTGAGATHQVTVNGTRYTASGASFGLALTATGVTGTLIPAAPADGCTAISTALTGRIALIDRGTCDFSTKALNAQQAGAIGVIVANNQGGTTTIPMGAGTGANRVRIPAVMVSQNDGATLKALTPVTANEALIDPQPLQIDAALDTDVVFHEYGHGLTWRMIGGMSGPLAGAIGEGMSDGVAMLVNNDDVVGEYSASNSNGIRRFRYQGYPLTYKDVTGAEVHDDGEIYGAIVWRMIELFRAAYGDTAGRNRLFTYVVDGMNFTPSTPTYEQMRDGILASVRNGATPSDCSLVWQAFGQFGVGVGALGVVNRSSVTITESFTVPASCN